MVLIDTSSWIEALRATGRLDVRQRVQELLAVGDAAWCDLVRVELWNGARGDAEKNALRHMEQLVLNLEIDAAVWTLAVELAQTARSRGLTVPAADLIIAACAKRHDVPVEHADQHLTSLLLL